MFNGAYKEPERENSPVDSLTTSPLERPAATAESLVPPALAARGERYFILAMMVLMLSIGIVLGTLISRPATAENRILISSSKGSLNDPSIFASVAQTVRPAVVNITSVEESSGRGLGGFFGQGGRRSGTGSGVIVDPNGHIITNNHVIDGASKITVRLFDGTELKGTVVGTDPETDLAVVKVDPKGKPLIAAKMGDSDKLEIGDWVLAIGSPFGLEQTVTQGIISAKERDAGGTNLQQFIQTDAAINPGNSGGPLVNLHGEVIGINTQIATRTGTYNGIGFALPSTTAVDVYNQLISGGQVHRGYLGIYPGRVPALIAKQNNLTDGEGALVRDLSDPNGPAANAGLQSGDIIVEFNGAKIKDERDLVRRVASTPVGTNAVLKFVRNGQPQSVTVKLGERPPVRPSPLNPHEPDEDEVRPLPPGVNRLGIEVETFTARKAEQLGLKLTPGVIITSVMEGSVADDAGLRINWIVLQINGQAVTTADDFNRIVKGLKSGDEVVFQVARRLAAQGDGLTRDFITLSIP